MAGSFPVGGWLSGGRVESEECFTREMRERRGGGVWRGGEGERERESGSGNGSESESLGGWGRLLLERMHRLNAVSRTRVSHFLCSISWVETNFQQLLELRRATRYLGPVPTWYSWVSGEYSRTLLIKHRDVPSSIESECRI